jgi:hypothetical protein
MTELFPRLIELFDGKGSQEHQPQWDALDEGEKVKVCDSLEKAHNEQGFELDVQFECKGLEHYAEARKEASIGRCAKEYEALVVWQSKPAANGGDKFLLKHTLTPKAIETLRRKKSQAEAHIKGYKQHAHTYPSPRYPVHTVKEFEKLIKKLTVDNLRQNFEKMEEDIAAAKQAFAEHQENKKKKNEVGADDSWAVYSDNPKFFFVFYSLGQNGAVRGAAPGVCLPPFSLPPLPSALRRPPKTQLRIAAIQ